MIVSIRSSDRKVKHWIHSHVYRVYYFRLFFEKEQQKNLSFGERKRISQKKEHLHKKIGEHMKYGESLQLSQDAMKSTTSLIVERVRKGKKPKEIIKELEEKGQI